MTDFGRVRTPDPADGSKSHAVPRSQLKLAETRGKYQPAAREMHLRPVFSDPGFGRQDDEPDQVERFPARTPVLARRHPDRSVVAPDYSKTTRRVVATILW